jgi:hypothetical protein
MFIIIDFVLESERLIKLCSLLEIAMATSNAEEQPAA